MCVRNVFFLMHDVQKSNLTAMVRTIGQVHLPTVLILDGLVFVFVLFVCLVCVCFIFFFLKKIQS